MRSFGKILLYFISTHSLCLKRSYLSCEDHSCGFSSTQLIARALVISLILFLLQLGGPPQPLKHIVHSWLAMRLAQPAGTASNLHPIPRTPNVLFRSKLGLLPSFSTLFSIQDLPTCTYTAYKLDSYISFNTKFIRN